jgi:pimeloyl-ACP methyl ester carboxylesterase
MVALPLASTARCGGPKAAVAFFGGPSPSAEAWAGGLEQRDGGWWPRFDADVMARTLREATGRSYGDEWERISCPVLVVRAGRGQLSAADAQAMVAHGQRVELFELPQAGHDLHLDSPEGWRAAVSRFLGVLDPA